MAGFRVVEVKQLDLFSVKSTFSFVNFVSEVPCLCEFDAESRRFRDHFGYPRELDMQSVEPGDVWVQKIAQRFVFHLVTKTWCAESTTLSTLHCALASLKEHVQCCGVSRLAITKAPLDNFPWSTIRALLSSTFCDEADLLVMACSSSL